MNYSALGRNLAFASQSERAPKPAPHHRTALATSQVYFRPRQRNCHGRRVGGASERLDLKANYGATLVLTTAAMGLTMGPPMF